MKKDSKTKVKQEQKKSGEEKSRYKTTLFIQSMILNLVNVVLIIAIVILFFLLPKKSAELSELTNNQVLEKEKTDAIVLQADVDKNLDKIDAIKDTQINESSLVRFFEYRDEITKIPGVTRFEISEKTISDRNKNVGYGITIEARGSGESINNVYKKIQGVPFLIEPMVFDIKVDENGEYILTYLGILYI